MQGLEASSRVAQNVAAQTSPWEKERFNFFSQGRWEDLLGASTQCDEAVSKVSSRRRRRHEGDSLEKRADRALDSIHMGELSAARTVLPLRLEMSKQLNSLRDPERRPTVPRVPLLPGVLHHIRDEEIDLDQERFMANLHSARRGAAGGPSGMTAEHLKFARGRMPAEILQAVRIGRMMALQKPQGGVRGIVVGDFLRRSVARTLAQQLGPAVELHTSPFQSALSTKSGCECVAHIAQAMTDMDPNTTLLSVDDIGAFDLISREAMLQGLLDVEGGGAALPFVRQFYGSPW